jgi:YidC/Oxa1 family membrane protein insertase
MFHTFIYQPLYNILIFLCNIIPGADFGIAIILLTLIVRLALIPIYKKQIEVQKKMQILQPELKELQKKHKNDKEKLTKEQMALYKKHGSNPFSGCLPMIIQIFFLFGIYNVLISVAKNGADTGVIYSFLKYPENINYSFLGMIDLAKPLNFSGLSVSNIFSFILSNFGHILLALLAAIAQYFQAKSMLPATTPEVTDTDKPDISNIMGKQMLVLGPVLTLLFGIQFPAGLSLYWLASTLFMFAQQLYMDKEQKNTKKDALKVN